MTKWTSNFNEKSSIVRLIIDSTFALPMIKSRSDLESLHRLSADMCYELHTQRTWLLQEEMVSNRYVPVNSRACMVPFLTLETVDDRLVQIG
jgi:hypothetical protein